MKDLLPFWPQLIILVLSGLSILKGFLFEGQIRKYNPTHLAGKIILTILKIGGYIYILALGGFYRHWGGAQIIHTIIYISVLIALITIISRSNSLNLKSEGTSTVSGPTTEILVVILLWWGGFFDQLIAFINQ